MVETIKLLKELIAIPSYSKKETEVADCLQQHIEMKGYTTGRKKNNLWILSPAFDRLKPTIMLNSHLDTVEPVSGWKRDPHTPSIENGRLYGLGSNDAGASLVSLFHLFTLLTEKEQPYNLIFMASAEEEVAGKDGMESALQELPRIDLAIVGEPTNMQLAIAEKGLMVVDCFAYGEAGHAARKEGVNAIYKALDDINRIRNTELPKKSMLLGEVKMTATMIQAGTQHNVIPDKCHFVLDVRTNECYTNEEVFEILKQNLQSELSPRSFRLSSSGINPNHPVVKQAVTLGLRTFGSPTLSDQALMPFPSVKIGPGDSSRSHSADEYVLIREIEEAIEVYYRLLDGFRF